MLIAGFGEILRDPTRIIVLNTMTTITQYKHKKNNFNSFVPISQGIYSFIYSMLDNHTLVM